MYFLCLCIFINNEWVNSLSGKVFPTINPCTGEKIIDVQEVDKVSTGEKIVDVQERDMVSTGEKIVDVQEGDKVSTGEILLIFKNDKVSTGENVIEFDVEDWED